MRSLLDARARSPAAPRGAERVGCRAAGEAAHDDRPRMTSARSPPLAARCASAHRRAASDFDPLLDLHRRRALVLHRRGVARHARVLPRCAPRSRKRLIREKGFAAVAVEADWPDAYRVNRYVRGAGDDARRDGRARRLRAVPAVDVAQRRRARLRRLAARAQRRRSPAGDAASASTASTSTACTRRWRRCSPTSTRSIPSAARRARERYACFDHFGDDPQAYGYARRAAAWRRSCEREVVAQLRRAARAGGRVRAARRPRRRRRLLLRRAERPRSSRTPSSTTARCSAAQRRVVEPARPAHGRDARGARRAFLGAAARPRKVVVWAHNSHLGDARATEMGDARRAQRRASSCASGTATRPCWSASRRTPARSRRRRTGTARPSASTCARRWPAATRRCSTRSGIPRFLLDLATTRAAARRCAAPRLERAIGVIYRPETERQSHYFTRALPEQFDCVLHFDETRAVEPLERTGLWERGELPETYPTAL